MIGTYVRYIIRAPSRRRRGSPVGPALMLFSSLAARRVFGPRFTSLRIIGLINEYEFPDDGPPKSGGSPAEFRESGKSAPQFANRSVRLSSGSRRIQQLARRTTGVAGELRAFRSVSSHGEHLYRGPGRGQAGYASRIQQLRE